MDKKQMSLAIGVVIIFVIILATWGYHAMTPQGRTPLEHGSVTLPKTGVPPMYAVHGTAPVAGQPGPVNPAALPGAPAEYKDYIAKHPGQTPP